MRKPVWILLSSIFLLASNLGAGQTAASDLRVATRYTSGPREFTTRTEYFSGENSRSEIQISSGNVKGHHRALVRRKGAEVVQVYDLDLDGHEYVSYQTDLRGGALAAKAIVVKPSGKTYVINIETLDTGERKEMFGHTARHMITKEKRIGGPENCYGGNSQQELDGWYIDFDAFPAQHRSGKQGVAVGILSISHGGGMCSDKIEVHRTGPQTGYPLKLKTTNTSELNGPDNSPRNYSSVSEMEVVEFVEAPLDPQLFQVPAGFRKVDRIVDPTQESLRLQAMTYWQRFKEEMRNLFH
jgi:hypothetical protein